MIDLPSADRSRKSGAFPAAWVPRIADRRDWGSRKRITFPSGDKVESFLVPRGVRRTKNVVVTCLSSRTRLLFVNRGNLAEPLKDGDVQLLAGLAGLLERPAKTKGKKNKPIPVAQRKVLERLSGRRTDYLAGFARTLLVMVNHVSFASMLLYSGDHALEKRRPMSRAEIARRAGVSVRSCSSYLRVFRALNVLHFEKAKRIKVNGKWRTQGPHIRRFNLHELRNWFDPGFGRLLFDSMVKKQRRLEAEAAAAAAPTTIEQIEERLAELRGRLKQKPNARDRHWLELQINELAAKLERLRTEPVRNAVRGALDDASKRASWKAPALGVKLEQLSDADRRALYDAVAEARPDLRTLADIQAEAARWLEPPADGSPTN